ncbi:MAG: hypothetical protein UV73_C0004G0129 [Candidatus Gottesmanbacteria bacterium GW2011_GWA2_43_14]|uniref:Uncharacterized protein n=1 Tax=Candidatus Gottesmanbacteria bacterium GW2011_GWA2_43_14 TaxID=1618443 RepID=A0A0G1DK81_9BACT|nr:MAG: hypothetical protein UV73_C0004G0129 [Candidatus Gottesmanbacteria bacterium GW2011_GWA2_43_14]
MVKKNNSENKHQSYLTGIVTGLLIGLLLFVLIPKLSNYRKATNPESETPAEKTASIKSDQLLSEVTQKVLPDKFNLGVSFGETVKKMVETGAIDKQKFLDLYQSRGGLPAEFTDLFDKDSSEKIIVTKENNAIILNLLWPLGIANKTKFLEEGPMKEDSGNYASTGGWTLGKEEGGKLFNRFPILPLTPEQEKEVIEIAQNIYRPCCGNSTYFPDCNHGAAMLGYIELAVVQGMSRNEIYKKALLLNSQWFPQTYVELAMYFKSKKGEDWQDVDPKEALGSPYSSGAGYQAINKELQSEGILPKVEGGGGCGV